MTEAIVIFGSAVRRDGGPSAAMRERVAAALRLGRTLGDPLYVPTGGVGRFGPAEAELMRELLVRAGVPPGRIRPESEARNTIRSVRNVRRMLPDFDGPVHAATSGYHLPRCVTLLRIAGFRARPCPPPRWRAGPYWWAREAVGLPVDAAVALWWRWRGRFGPVEGVQHEAVLSGPNGSGRVHMMETKAQPENCDEPSPRQSDRPSPPPA